MIGTDTTREISSPPPTEEQVLAYIAEMCAELQHLVRRPRFHTIRYLLDMARLEAEREFKARGRP